MKKLILICFLFTSFLAHAQFLTVAPTFIKPNPPVNSMDSLGYTYPGKPGGYSFLYNAELIRQKFARNPDGIISGLKPTTISGTTATTPAGSWSINQVTYSKGTSTNTTIAATTGGQYREDILVANTSNALALVSGSPGTDYTPPSIPANTIPVAEIFISPTADSTSVPATGYLELYSLTPQYLNSALFAKKLVNISGTLNLSKLSDTTGLTKGLVVRTSDGKVYTQTISGGGAVSSVFGRTGAVVASSGDYSAYYQAIGTYLTPTSTNTVTNKDLTSGTNTFPTFNQNTTGSAAKWTTAQNLAGNSVDGSANVAFANKFIVQGTSDAGLSAAQFLGSLGTGLVKNTTTTGVLSIATAGTDYQTPITLTTTGSGAASLTGSALNIPIPVTTSVANPTGTIGLTAVNGSATTAMRSDAAPALSQAIAPVWTAKHTYLQTGLGETLADALFLQTTTAATSGTFNGTTLRYSNQQDAPGLHFEAQGYATGSSASKPGDFYINAIGTQSTTGGAQLAIWGSVNGSTPVLGFTMDGLGNTFLGTSSYTTGPFAASSLSITGGTNFNLTISPSSTNSSSNTNALFAGATTVISKVILASGSTGTGLDISGSAHVGAGVLVQGGIVYGSGTPNSWGANLVVNPLTFTTLYPSTTLTNNATLYVNGPGIGAVNNYALYVASGNSLFGGPVILKGYTVATLPTAVVGMTAYVTDALSPVSLNTVTGGGSSTVPVFYNGSNWIAQ